jgi:integrase
MIEAALIEPSFADVLAALETTRDLTAQKRAHWACSVGQIARVLDTPPELIPARWTAARFPVGRLHHARIGWTAKTLANHKSNVRAALQWFCKEQDVPSRGARLRPDWARLRERLSDQRARAILSGLMRRCSALAIAPEDISEPVVDDYMRYRSLSTALAADNTARRSLARVWNACVSGIPGWPSQRLIEPPIKASAQVGWDEFPERLRTECENYFARLATRRRSINGRRLAPCKPSTIRTRRAELVAMARSAVRLGARIESLTSLAVLLDPALVEKVIEAYWQKDGAEPKVFTIDLAGKLLRMARDTGCLDESGLARLDDIRASLEEHRTFDLTQKNMTLVRQVLTDGVWTEVVDLPTALLAKARADCVHAPVKAAVTAQLAVAIAILTVAPIRLQNLVSIRLEENLIKPGGLQTPYWLVYPRYDVKNRVDLNFPLDQSLTDLIDEYIHDFRPVLLRSSNGPWLFPGEHVGCKTAAMFSDQISTRIEKATGLCITVHQFRHAAAAIYLKHHPGEYETVRRLLGHRNIQTTINFYCGLQTIQATEAFGKLIRETVSRGEDRPSR